MDFRNIKQLSRNFYRPVPRPVQGSLFFLLCTFLIFSGCVTDDVGIMRYELNMLKTEVKNIKKTSKNMESELPGQTKQLNTKMRKIENAQKATGKSVSDLLFRIQALTTDFQSLNGQIEETRYYSEKSSNELVKSNDAILARLTELETAVKELKKKLPSTKPEPGQKDTKKGSKSGPAGGGIADQNKTAIKNIYMEGYRAYTSGKTTEAREKFMSILTGHPENDYSDNARFWIGESYYSEERYEDAILAYEELFKKNPESDKVPGAMLKQGLAFYALKDKKTGKIILEKLIEKHPESEQAKTAARKIRKIATPRKKK